MDKFKNQKVKIKSKIQNGKIYKNLEKLAVNAVHTLQSSSGQTLIEAIAAIAVAVVIVTALVTLGISTQKVANTSKNQSQNTLYGQETIELIRSVRDAKLNNSVRDVPGLPCTTTSSCTFIDLFGASFLAASPLYFSLSSAPVTLGCNTSTVDCYQLTWQSSSAAQPIGTTIYKRVIKVWDMGLADPDDPSNIVKFIEVTVSWEDSAGTHNSVTSTKLTNFR